MVPKVLPTSRTSLPSRDSKLGLYFPLEDVDINADLEFSLGPERSLRLQCFERTIPALSW